MSNELPIHHVQGRLRTRGGFVATVVIGSLVVDGGRPEPSPWEAMRAVAENVAKLLGAPVAINWDVEDEPL